MTKAECLSPIAGGAEFNPPKEKFVINFNAMTVGGGPGTGTTSAVDLMSSQLEIPSFKAGELFRRWERRFGTHSDVIGYVSRDPAVDIKIDEITERRMRAAMGENQPAIFETRLGGWIATKIGTDGPNILYVVSKDIGAQRVWRREKEKNPNFSKSVKKVKIELTERQRDDFKAWKTAHPDLPGNPIDPGFRIGNKRVYDIVINTDNLSVQEVVEQTYIELTKKGFLSKSS